MYDFILRYLASVFVDTTEIEVSDRNMVLLLKALLRRTEFDWIPTGVDENKDGKKTRKLGYITDGNEWQLIVASNRIDVAKFPTSETGDNMGLYKDFCTTALSLLKITTSVFELNGHRLASVREGLLPEMTNDKTEFIMNQLLNRPPSFKSSTPFEWNWRIVTSVDRTFGKRTEPTNTIITAKRINDRMEDAENPGVFVDIDRIRVDLDINTSQRNSENRFNGKDVEAFLKKLPIWHRKLEDEFQDFIRGDFQ